MKKQTKIALIAAAISTFLLILTSLLDFPHQYIIEIFNGLPILITIWLALVIKTESLWYISIGLFTFFQYFALISLIIFLYKKISKYTATALTSLLLIILGLAGYYWRDIFDQIDSILTLIFS